MSCITDLTLVALVTVYIVDISGFTQSWRSLLSRITGVKNLRSLPPFDCGKCMTFWVCLIYSGFNWGLTLPIIGYSCFLSFLSVPIGNSMIFIREWIIHIIDKLMPR